MGLSTLKISDRLRSLMAYDKFAGPAPRMLVLETRYWLDGACLRAARRRGWEVLSVPVVMEGILPRSSLEGLLHGLGTFRPDFVLTVNFAGMDEGGLLARIFSDLGIPYVAWFIDNPRTILMDRLAFASDYAVAVSWERAYIPYLEGLGFPVVRHLPLGVDTELFDGVPDDPPRLPPTFVGNTDTLLAEREWDWLQARPGLARAVADALDAGRVTREAFAEGLTRLLGRDTAAALDPEERRHAEYYLFLEGTRRHRLAWIGSLASEGVETRGDEAWRTVCPRAGGPVHYEAELPGFYRACAVNLNSTSLQMPTAVNQRVFDCPAAGGFLLTDAQADLEELFDPDTEVAVYRSNEECRDRLRYYRDRPEARGTVVANARRRIQAHHTYERRLETLAGILRERFAS